jgi:dTDP-4-amino-4,6-dideoxygalactose transaminase
LIPVTKPFLPPKEEYQAQLQRAWDKRWITNNGELVVELEEELKTFLDVKHLLFCSNGTIVLQMALRALNITKEVITTPFSHVATTNAILWEKCKPVFVDIDAETLCIDADKIESAITEDTEAILATHIYGYPCDIDTIEKIAYKHKLKVIYDAAHAFGCTYKGKSLLSFGDVSTCSFHATKIFHTVEGGCVITNNVDVAKQLFLFRQFGYRAEEYFSIGINAKNSEFHAAMGLCLLPKVDDLIAQRKKICSQYENRLKDLNLQQLSENEFLKYNYAFYPVIFNSEESLLKAKQALELQQVFPHRYFHPTLNHLPYLNTEWKVACLNSEDISTRILCLPLYHDLTAEEVDFICNILLEHKELVN